MVKKLHIVGMLATLLALGACAAGSAEAGHAAGSGALSQGLLGLWHGIIAPITLIVEIINRLAPKLLPWSLHVYEVKATGAAYDFGFYLGLISAPSLILRGWSRRR